MRVDILVVRIVLVVLGVVRVGILVLWVIFVVMGVVRVGILHMHHHR